MADNLYTKVVEIREGGGVVTASTVMAATHGIMLSTDRSKLAEFGGPVDLNWAYILLDAFCPSNDSKEQAHSKVLS